MKGTTYSMRSWWSDGPEDPASVGGRFLAVIDRLGLLGPEMANWWLLDFVTLADFPLAEARLKMAWLVENNIATDEFDEPIPDDGYRIFTRGSEVSSEVGTPRTVDFKVTAGSKWYNELEFEIGGLRSPPDLTLVTYPTYKGALEIIASEWPCPWLFVDCIVHVEREILPGVPIDPDPRPPFQNVWIAYLSPALAAGVTPSPELTFERTPGGGLIMSAADERFDPANADHLRRSRILQFIMTEQVGPAIDSGMAPTRLPARIGPY